MNTLHIRRASDRDAAAIEDLYQQLVSNPALAVSPEHLAKLQASEHHVVLVAEQGDQVCGTALLSLCEDIMFGTQPFAVVENVIVNEAYRSQGIGAALFREIEAHCKRANCSKIMLLSSAQRSEAHQFFEQLGFSGTSKRGFVKYRRQFG
ncbi:GNAT family N-acetyltransferase [Chitinimonas sp.]|uniref:GNAT family N-acetyltransferase n=1 Tax=Chitinimonas sp. TaxID=1934313 RepID=UPI0035AEFB4A